METITDTISKIFERVNSLLHSIICQHSCYHKLFIFSRDEQRSACCTRKNAHEQRQPTVTVTIAEMHHPSSHCAPSHCLVSINIQQALMNFSGCNFFHMEETNSIPLLHVHFDVRCHFVRLPLCCHLSHSNNT